MMKTPDLTLHLGARKKPKQPSVESSGTSQAPVRQAPPFASPPASDALPTLRWGINEPHPLPVVALVKSSTPPPAARWVRSELAAPEAKAVFLAGSFNDWNPSATPMMRLHDRKWAKELWLAAVRYDYLFIVDGQWTPDPEAKDSVPNPFGGCNSVLKVE